MAIEQSPQLVQLLDVTRVHLTASAQVPELSATEVTVTR
jgi:hypothetical protein